MKLKILREVLLSPLWFAAGLALIVIGGGLGWLWMGLLGALLISCPICLMIREYERNKRRRGMKIEEFNKEIPDLEGFTIGEARLSGGEVAGFVLIDKDGVKRYILRFNHDIRVEPYW